MALLFVFPFFGERAGTVIEEVSLSGLTNSWWYIIVPYYALVLGLIVLGILTLVLQNSTAALWMSCKRKLSLGISVLTTLVFVLSMQPYAAQFTFLFLVIKALMLIKWA